MFRSPRLPSPRSLFLLIFCFAVRAYAQFSAATVTGVVQDSSKAGIADAQLKLINTQTGTENSSTTNHEGGFLLPGVIPGVYTLQIESHGFATTQVNGITLNGGDTKNLLIRMKVGGVTETVSVDASGLTLNRTDAAVSTVVDSKLISSVPLNGRSLQDLFLAVPGIVTQTPQAATQTGSQTQGELSVNGQRTGANSFFVDGVSVNAQFGLRAGASHLGGTGSIGGFTALGTTQGLISIEALQEFRILTSTFSAEYGRTPGGQFTFVTRSGGNRMHGSVYEYLRGNYLDAREWFSGSRGSGDPARYSQSDFGATLAGPLAIGGINPGRDNLFYFLSYEGLTADQPTPQAYPFGPYLCIYGNVNCLSTTYAVFRSFPYAYPIFDASGNPEGLGFALVPSASFPSHFNSMTVRVDRTFSPRLSTFLRYGNTPSDGQANQLYSARIDHSASQSLTFGATNQIASAWSHEFRLGYATEDSHIRTSTEEPGTVVQGRSQILSTGSLNTALGIPADYSSSEADAYIHISGIGDSDSNTNRADNSSNQWNLRDILSVNAQDRLFKFGVDARHVTSHETPASLSVVADYLTYESMLGNTASELVVSKNLPASPVVMEFSAFAEDEWKLTHSLTLSSGLRWDVNPAPTGQHGHDAFTILGDVHVPETLRLAPRGTPLWQTSWFNFAPRVGAAWAIRDKPSTELIVRAGAGVFFDTGTEPGLQAFHGIGFANSAHSLNVSIPASSSVFITPVGFGPPYTGAHGFAFSPHQQLPYTLQWSIGAEQALGRNQSLTVSYVGANGRRLLEEQRRNVSAANRDFGNVSYFPGNVTSGFQSLQAKFQRSFSAGFQGLASYTCSHSLDYGSTAPFYPLRKGNSDLDVRHNIEAAASWSSPQSTSHLFTLARIKEGWGVDARLMARTGFPVNLLGSFSLDPITAQPYYGGVDLVGGRPLYLYGSQYPGGRAFNGGVNSDHAAFVLPDAPSPGNAPRNLVRGFPAIQGNLAIRQNFQLPKQVGLQFKVETFNLANHPAFGYIDPSLTDLLFGQANKTLGQSFGAAGALYNEGGPRAIQLSLKATF